ncbi:hypothetical protein HRbin35_00389 [bacterium HR35]|nr:hypothetical protein HRbin35_00389 [bacterium HR35]
MIYGNEEAQKLVKDWLETEKRGALLIAGPEGVGKFSFVKEFLKTKIDWEVITLRSEKKMFYIETARFFTKITQTKTKNKRVILIDEVHKFREESQNVLLKTIEEPSSTTLFVLISHRTQKILPTIRSRSLAVKFTFVPQELNFKFLKEKNFSEAEIDFALLFYPYQPGKAYHLIKDKHKIDFFKRFLNLSTTAEKIEILKEATSYFKLDENLNFSDKFSKIYKEIIEILILKKRKNLIEKLKNKKQLNYHEIEEIKELIDFYNETEYDYHWFLQLTNFLLTYG